MFATRRKFWRIAIGAMGVGMAAVRLSQSWAASDATGAPNPAEWRLYGNGTGQLFYSPIDEINDKNVSRLGLAWSVDLPTKDGPVGNILVADGVAYESAAGGLSSPSMKRPAGSCGSLSRGSILQGHRW